MTKKANDLSKIYYRAFGISIHSEIKIDGFFSILHLNGKPDLVIRLGKIPNSLKETPSRHNHIISKNYFYLELYDIAYYLIFPDKILIEPIGVNPCWESIKLFLVDSCFPILMHYRNKLPIVASGIFKKDKAILITGKPFSGKSFITSELIKRGFDFFTDDICILDTLFDNGRLVLHPSTNFLTIWEQKHLSEKRNFIRNGIRKYYYKNKLLYPKIEKKYIFKIFHLTNLEKSNKKIEDSLIKKILFLRSIVKFPRLIPEIYGEQLFLSQSHLFASNIQVIYLNKKLPFIKLIEIITDDTKGD